MTTDIHQQKKDVKNGFRTKNPAQVIVLGDLGSDGSKMPPYFFKPDQKIGFHVYCTTF